MSLLELLFCVHLSSCEFNGSKTCSSPFKWRFSSLDGGPNLGAAIGPKKVIDLIDVGDEDGGEGWALALSNAVLRSTVG